jgi:hypothetical protein
MTPYFNQLYYRVLQHMHVLDPHQRILEYPVTLNKLWRFHLYMSGATRLWKLS